MVVRFQAMAVALFGFAAIAACAAAMPVSDAQGKPGEAAPAAGAPDGEGGELGAGDAGAGDAGARRCPHGALEDAHRGFVRCLAPGEADAGWLPPGPQRPDAAADAAGADAAPGDGGPRPDAGAADAGPLPLVTVSAPAFDNGEVPKLERILKGVAPDIGRCVADNGGLAGTTGRMRVAFLVRARGRAEGVEVQGLKGITEAAASCVRLLLKNKAVGAPTADPVGVTVTFSLAAAK